jgi:tryptophan synthase beta chain
MTVINLATDEIPRKWYNILTDLGGVPPPKGKKALGKLQQYGIKECLKQEFSDQRYILIPPELLKKYEQVGRPRPLVRAERLERALKLPEDKIRLYFKREDLSPTGSHKVNTAIAQAYFAAQEGKEILVTETGAGQWGSALAYGAMLNDLDSRLFWVRSVYNWKPDRRAFMESMGAEVWASPSKMTKIGRKLLKQNPVHPGSLSIAIAEGIENTMDNLPKSVYSLGSVLNHVLMHQTIIGQEAIRQFEKVDDYPDAVISCLGGGSNYGGLMIPFAGQVLRGENEKEIEFIAAQSEVAPNLSKGIYRYDYADHGEQTPKLKMLTLGHQAEMEPIKGDGLRYHAAAPIISKLRADKKMVKTVVYPQDEKLVFEGALMLWQKEGVLAASETAYSVRCAIDEALQAKKEFNSGKIDEKVILFNLSGHGFYDLVGYKEVLGDRMNKKVSLEDLERGFAPIPI